MSDSEFLPRNTQHVISKVYERHKRRISLEESQSISLSCIASIVASEGDTSTKALYAACHAEHKGRFHIERGGRLVQQHPFSTYEGVIEEVPTPVPVPENTKDVEDVQATLRILNPDDVDILERRYLDKRNPTVAALAVEDGVSCDTQKKRLRRAKLRFKKAYRKVIS